MSELPWENKTGNANSSNEHSPNPDNLQEAEHKNENSPNVNTEGAPDIFANAIKNTDNHSISDKKPEITVHPAFLPKTTVPIASDKEETVKVIKAFESNDSPINTVQRNIETPPTIEKTSIIEDVVEENNLKLTSDSNVSIDSNNNLKPKKTQLPLFEPKLPDLEITSFAENEQKLSPFPDVDQPRSPFTEPEQAKSPFPENETVKPPFTEVDQPRSPFAENNQPAPPFDNFETDNNIPEIPPFAIPEQKSEVSGSSEKVGFLASISNKLKKITQKKKLIDRMEEAHPPSIEDVSTVEPENESPFIKNNIKDIEPVDDIPISPAANDIVETADIADIRTVIPIENPIISKLEPMIEEIETPIPTISSEEVQEIKDELANSKWSQQDIVSNITGIDDSIEKMDISLKKIKQENESTKSNINTKIDKTTYQIKRIEEQLDEFENTLENIHTDNSELRSGLTTIEENIAELTNSHSVVLSQLQKITEFGNSRSAEIFATNDRIDKVEESLSSLTQIQSESQKGIQELRTVASDIIRGLEKTHKTNTELKTENEEQTNSFKEELELLTDFVEKEFKNIGARSFKVHGENIQLNNIIKNSTNMKLCMEWLEFLMELVGHNHLPDILSYYEELEWISEDVRLELLRYAEGIDYYIEKSDWKLTPDDHVKSIWFIEQLAGLKVDKNRLSMIDKDIKKIKKGTELYGI